MPLFLGSFPEPKKVIFNGKNVAKVNFTNTVRGVIEQQVGPSELKPTAHIWGKYEEGPAEADGYPSYWKVHLSNSQLDSDYRNDDASLTRTSGLENYKYDFPDWLAAVNISKGQSKNYMRNDTYWGSQLGGYGYAGNHKVVFCFDNLIVPQNAFGGFALCWGQMEFENPENLNLTLCDNASKMFFASGKSTNSAPGNLTIPDCGEFKEGCDMTYMFNSPYNQTVNWASVTLPTTKMSPGDMSGMFAYGPADVPIYNITSVDLLSCTSASNMCRNCRNTDITDHFKNFNITNKCTSLKETFVGSSLTEIDMSGADVSNVETCQEFLRGHASFGQLTSANMSGLHFANCKNFNNMFTSQDKLTSLDTSTWGMESAEDLGGTFAGLSNVTTIDMSSGNVTKAKTTSYMFGYSSSVTWSGGYYNVGHDLDFSKGNTPDLTTTAGMFRGCRRLVSVTGIGNLMRGGKVTTIANMFEHCDAINIDNSDLDWDTSSLTTTASAFVSCYKLGSTTDQIVDLTSWDVSKVTDMQGMFQSDTGMLSLDITGGVAKASASLRNMFYGCKALTKIKGIENLVTSTTNTLQGMFYQCNNLVSSDDVKLDLSGGDVSNILYMNEFAFECKSLKQIDVTNGVASKISSGYRAFKTCSSLESIIEAKNLITSACTGVEEMFCSCAKLNISNDDLAGGDMSNVTTTAGMFYGCSTLGNEADRIVDLTPGNVSKVTTASGMFYGNSSMQKVDITGGTATVLSNISSMFYGCAKLLKVINVENLVTSVVTTINGLFRDCALLDISNDELNNWDTTNVTNMGTAFYGCTSLGTAAAGAVDISAWDVSNMTNMGSPFQGCNTITSLDITGGQPRDISGTGGGLFYGLSNLTTIYGSTWDNRNSDRTFQGLSTKLIGGNGTVWTDDATHWKATYAVIDGSLDDDGNPREGYFTQR